MYRTNYVFLGHGNEIHSFWSPPSLKIHAALCFFIRVQRSPRMCSTSSNLMVVFTAGSMHWIHDGKVETVYQHLSFWLFKNSHFQSWSGISNRAIFKACNVSARLGLVRTFANLHHVCHGAARDSEPEDCLLYCSSRDGSPRKELLGDVIYTFVLLFNWKGMPLLLN